MNAIGIALACLLAMSGLCFGDELNVNTGEYIMDMGDGNKINVETGEYYMNLD